MRSLSIAVGTYGLTEELRSGRGLPAGLQLAPVTVEPITKAMRAMVRGLEYDICEMAFTTYLCAKAHGKPITAIPAFLTRNFHHRALFVNTKAGIRSPKDLEGRRVAVNRGYTVTTGLWARGALQHDYGVDLGKITWVATDDEHVAEYRPPANVDMTFANKKDVVELLVSGDCAAAVGDVKTDHPDIKPLIADARDAGIAYYKKTGIYPLNHAVVIKDSVLAEMPGIAGRLMDAFAQSKAAYMARLEQLHREPKRNGTPSLLVGEGWGGGDGNERAGLGATRIGTAGVPPNPFPSPQGGGELRLTSADEAAIALGKAVGGDPFPYGIEANRKALEAMVQYAVEQHVMPRGYSAEELFAATHQ